MKKIISLSVCIIVMFSLCLTVFASMKDNVTVFYHEDFENVTTTAKQWKTYTTTNYGIKDYQFVTEGEDTSLEITGWTNAEKTENATGLFTFEPETQYSLTSYPNSILVYRFTFNYSKLENGSNPFLLFAGKEGNMGQLQLAYENGTAKIKLNNVTYSGEVPEGEDTVITVICNFSTQKISVIVGENEMKTRTFSSRSTVTASDYFTLTANKDQIFTVDDICVFSAKTTDYAFEAEGLSCENEQNVKIDSSISAYLSSFPMGSFGNYVEIKQGDTVLTKDKYTLSTKMMFDSQSKPYVSLDVDFLEDMAYNTNYTVTLKQGMTDIFGSTLASDVPYTYKTEEKPQLTLASFAGNTGMLSIGTDITSGSDFSGKYNVFTANIKNNMVNSAEAYVVIALYNESDEIIDCGFIKSEFLPGTEKTFSHGFYVPENSNVKCFAVDSLKTMSSLMDAVTFQ